MSIYTEQEKKKSLWHPITDEDFDIDFNQYKYLMETRLSGALIDVYSAIALEEPVAASDIGG